MDGTNPLYTIGYGDRTLAAFIAVLQQHGIAILVDVRSQPYSRHKPEFSKTPLQEALSTAGIRYAFMGDTLGGRPDDPSCYTNGEIDYRAVEHREFYRSGIDRLHAAARQELRTALMCSEGKPENCHRTRLIGRTLVLEGIDVLHIDERDTLISQQEALTRLNGGQQQLFEQEPDPPKNRSASLAAAAPIAPPAGSDEIEQVLREVFGYRSFRPLQAEIIRSVLDRRDSLAIMPTGSGKSLCYQLPAVMGSGLTVVVSPLISLMEDQVVQLKGWGIAAEYLNSSMDYAGYQKASRAVRAGEVRLVYVAPETLLRQSTILLLQASGADRFVIDEAHCISEWGHDFRPEYRRLAEVREKLPDMVTLAVTATATDRVRRDIKQTLGIPDANVFIGSFDRPNLHLAVRDKLDAFGQALAFLDDHKGEAGIIYCATRDTVDLLASELAARGHPALPYHAGMSSADRRSNQHAFRFEDGRIIVATIAFGMGIDKPDVRFILHYDLPKNLESYYQQIGRAGRDGLPADCLLLYSYGDVHTIRYFMPEDPVRRRGEEQRLQTFLAFVEATGCRRPPLLRYFGEAYPSGRCGACDRCDQAAARTAGRTPRVAADAAAKDAAVDLTEPARWFLETALRTGELFGAAHLVDVLRGSKGKRVLEKKHDRLDTYGIGSGYSKEAWRVLSGLFIREGLLRRAPPHGSLELTPAGEAVLSGGAFASAHPDAAVRTPRTEKGVEYDAALFSRLKEVRSRLAGELSVPPYVVFHDRSLMEMAARRPQDEDAFGRVFGVGQQKLENYGEAFLDEIRAYCLEHPAVEEAASSRRPAGGSLKGLQRTAQIQERYAAGRTLNELAAEFGFTPQTILKHLARAYETGLPLAPDGLLASSELANPDRDRVVQAFAEHGTQYLKPVFEALEETVPYGELHLWRLILEITRDPEDPLSQDGHGGV